MKRLLLVVAVMAVAGCAPLRTPMEPAAPVARVQPAPAPQRVSADGVPIQEVPFVPGVSSMTVEKMAAAQACKGGEGAALVTPAGPVEVYRMRCDNGRVFMARCEFRQCKQM